MWTHGISTHRDQSSYLKALQHPTSRLFEALSKQRIHTTQTQRKYIHPLRQAYWGPDTKTLISRNSSLNRHTCSVGPPGPPPAMPSAAAGVTAAAPSHGKGRCGRRAGQGRSSLAPTGFQGRGPPIVLSDDRGIIQLMAAAARCRMGRLAVGGQQAKAGASQLLQGAGQRSMSDVQTAAVLDHP